MELLASGLDTIECAYYLNAGPECKLDFAALRLQREVMRESKQPEAAVLELGGMEFLLSPNGTKSGYPFVMSNQDCTIQFGEFNNPSFFVRYSSFALWCKGAKFLHERFLAWARDLGLQTLKPEGLSRVDFAFDFLLPEIDFDEDSYVTAASKDSQHRKDGKVQTFTFGRDEIVLRVYNKSDEIKEASGKYWFYLFWQEQTENVWRVEWQIRKETLKRFGLRTFQDLFDGYGDVLRYLISEHTSLRVKSEDSNRSRWPVHPLWSLLSEHINTLPAQGVYREVDPRMMLDETLIRMAISMEGYLQTLLLTGARPGEVLALRWSEINTKWRGLTIRDKVEGERVIPLTPYVSHLLHALPRRNEWVFSSLTAANGVLTIPRNQHNEACRVAGIDGLTLHGLRRSFKSLTEWLEIPAGVVAQLMGHKPSATAEKHYTVRPLDLLRVHHEKIEAWILEQAGIVFDAKAAPGALRVVVVA